jgi:hypothetical protein
VSPSEEIQISDASLKYVILSAFSAVVRFNPQFPVMVDRVEENYDERQQIESFTIVTKSGLRFRVSVDFEEDAHG